MPTLPSSIALTQPPDGALLVASDTRSDNTSAQTAVNAMITALSGGAAGQVLKATSSTAVQWGAGVTSYRKTTPRTVNGGVEGVTETDLLNGEITVAAGVLGTTGVLRLTMWGDMLNNTGVQQFGERYKVKLGAGATVVIDTGSDLTNNGGAKVMYTGAARCPWRAVVEIFNLGATNAQLVKLWAQRDGDVGQVPAGSVFTTGIGADSTFGSNGAGLGAIVHSGHNTAAIDTTAAMPIAFTVILPAANASLEWKLIGALAEVV